MMKLEIQRENVKLAQLHEELMTAIPALALVLDEEKTAKHGRTIMTSPLRLYGNEFKVFFEVPDDTDVAEIQAIVDAHLPVGPDVPKTIDEIEASLGSNPGKQRRALAELLAERPDIVKRADL